MFAGIAAYVGLHLFSVDFAMIAAGDVFFVVYLVAMIRLALRSNVDKLRDRAKNEDEGIVAIVGLTGVAIAFSFVSMFSLLGSKADPSMLHLILAIASIPLGWAVLHALFAFHYARLYYAPASMVDGKASDAGGLQFLDTPHPGIVEFMYFSFTIGATAQTSDVNLRSTDFRKVVLFHGVASFVYNTVLLALAVNVAASLIQ